MKTIHHFLLLMVLAALHLHCFAASQHTAQTPAFTLDTRTTPIARVLAGTRRISPIAEKADANARLLVDGVDAPGWSPSFPDFDSAALPNGWHLFRLQEGKSTVEIKLMVLNGNDFKLSNDGFVYSIADNQATLHGFLDQTTTAIVIPETLGALPVTTIAEGALSGMKQLKSVVLPDTVLTIGDNAFAECTALLAADLGGGAQTLGASAFASCTKLKSITLPATLEAIGDAAFRNCTALPSLTIPANVATIGDGVFVNCTDLKTFCVEDGTPAVSAENGLLLSADGMRLVAVPTGVTGNLALPATIRELAAGAFAGCAKLTTVRLPADLASIGADAFQNCTALTEVLVPDGVTSIGEDALAGCTKARLRAASRKPDGHRRRCLLRMQGPREPRTARRPGLHRRPGLLRLRQTRRPLHPRFRPVHRRRRLRQMHETARPLLPGGDTTGPGWQDRPSQQGESARRMAGQLRRKLQRRLLRHLGLPAEHCPAPADPRSHAPDHQC